MLSMIIRVMEKISLQSIIIYGYSHLHRKQIKDNMMVSEERNVECFMQS